KTAPATASVITPDKGRSYSPNYAPGSFSGSVADNTGGGGLNANSTTFTLQRSSDNKYWNGSTWQTAAYSLAATNAATTGSAAAGWTSSATLPAWSSSSQADGTYPIRATATHLA